MTTNSNRWCVLLLLWYTGLATTGTRVQAQPPVATQNPPVPELWQPDPKQPIYLAASIFNRQGIESLNASIERVVGTLLEPETPHLVAAELRLIRGDYNIAIENIQVAIQGTHATATVELSLHNRWVSARQTEKVSLRRADENDALSAWKIVPDDPVVIFADEQAGLIQRLATCLASPRAFILESRKRATTTNVKAILLGLRQFVLDYDGRYDLNAGDFRRKLQPYLASDTVFTAPADPPGKTSYILNPNLEGMAAIELDAAKTVLIYEGRNGQLHFAYDGKAIVDFADGHTEFVTPQQALQLQWKP